MQKQKQYRLAVIFEQKTENVEEVWHSYSDAYVQAIQELKESISATAVLIYSNVDIFVVIKRKAVKNP